MHEPAPARTKRRLSLRAWLRALHRDTGYFVVGLTFIYALSGLAVNHIADWDPSFRQIDRTHQIALPLPPSDAAAASTVLQKLRIEEKAKEIYREGSARLDIVLENRTLHVETDTGRVLEEGQEPRFFLRLANWLHLNRGKKAWTFVADAYAVLLLFLATSGLFMLSGRKGLAGRGAVIATLGAAVPLAYVVLSGGP